MYKKYLLNFHEMSVKDQLAVLGLMIFRLTICGRDTYVAESVDVEDPVRLREITELIHRIASLHLHIAKQNYDELDSFIDGTFATIDYQISRLNISWPYLLS